METVIFQGIFSYVEESMNKYMLENSIQEIISCSSSSCHIAATEGREAYTEVTVVLIYESE